MTPEGKYPVVVTAEVCGNRSRPNDPAGDRVWLRVGFGACVLSGWVLDSEFRKRVPTALVGETDAPKGSVGDRGEWYFGSLLARARREDDPHAGPGYWVTLGVGESSTSFWLPKEDFDRCFSPIPKGGKS